jgi:cytosine/adenosine deaminase-related metal-dependent hydrolase
VSTTTFAADWLLPISGPPVAGGWIEVASGRIRRTGSGDPPTPTQHLGNVAIMPGLVNAHTHLELSWMAGLIPPAPSMPAWISRMLHLRRLGPPGGAEGLQRAAHDAARAMQATGTVLVGDISNSLLAVGALVEAGLGGVVFHEILGFNVADPAQSVRDAWDRIAAVPTARTATEVPLTLTVAAHAPYSVSPALFREIAQRNPGGPLAVHLAESADEVEFLRAGGGAIRAILEELGVWVPSWQAPQCDPVEYLHQLGYLQPGLLAVHAVHLADEALERLREAGATVVTCPRSNVWVGVGMPRLAHFYAAGVPVAIGTDSLASVQTLNLFDELAEMRRIAPEISAASLLDSATRVGAEALGLGGRYGTLDAGKQAAMIAVDVPPGVTDVEEYLVSGVPASSVRRLF